MYICLMKWNPHLLFNLTCKPTLVSNPMICDRGAMSFVVFIDWGSLLF